MSKTAHIVLGAPSEEAVFPDPLADDMVIGVDRGAQLCVSKGIALTMAVGDFDSISATDKAEIQAMSDSFYEFDADKDDTDAEIALTLAMKDKTVTQIAVYNWAGGRQDHLLSVIFMIYQPRFQPILSSITLINAINTITFYEPGEYTLLKEESKTYLSFIGMTPIKKLSLKRVKYALDQKDYAYPIALISNEFLGQDCEFSFEEGILAVIQSTDK